MDFLKHKCGNSKRNAVRRGASEGATGLSVLRLLSEEGRRQLPLHACEESPAKYNCFTLPYSVNELSQQFQKDCGLRKRYSCQLAG